MLLWVLLAHPVIHAREVLSGHGHGAASSSLECPLCAPTALDAAPALLLALAESAVTYSLWTPHALLEQHSSPCRGRSPPLL